MHSKCCPVVVHMTSIMFTIIISMMSFGVIKNRFVLSYCHNWLQVNGIVLVFCVILVKFVSVLKQTLNCL